MADPPRVLFVTGAYAPEFSAGGLQCQAVARVLKGRAAISVLTTSTTAGLPARTEVEGVPVTRVHVKLGESPLRSTGVMVGALRELLPDVDVIHIQGFSMKNVLLMAMARWFRRPVIVHLQTARHDEPETIGARGVLAWWAFSSADYYLAVSAGLHERYLAGGLPPDRIECVPNGVDTTRFQPSSVDQRMRLRRELGFPADAPLILFVGVISPDKQPHVLLDAWAEAEEQHRLGATLVFVGATDPRLFELNDRLADQMQQRLAAIEGGDRVRFVPPTRDIERYYRAADVLVMPSIREGLPNVVLEAMASGLPIVASRLPGSTETLIEDRVNGRLVEPGDRSGFAAAIADVLRDPAGASRLGAAARRTAEERYSIELVADRWLATYQRVLSAA